MDCSPTDWRHDNFYRPPVWRLWRASYRIQNRIARDTQVDDEWVEVAMRLVAVPNSPERAGVSEDALAAFDLWLADQSPRWILEARLLTSQSFSEIAAACSLTEPVVRAFHEMFFDVRSKLQASDWIMSLAVRSHPLNDFAGPQPAGILKYAAFTGGPRLLEAISAVALNRPLPTWLTDSFGDNPRWGEAYFRARVKLTIAIMTAKSDHKLGSLVELTGQLQSLEKAAGVPVRDDPLLPVMGAILSALERPKRKGPTPADARPVTKAVSDRTVRPEPTLVQGGAREE